MEKVNNIVNLSMDELFCRSRDYGEFIDLVNQKTAAISKVLKDKNKIVIPFSVTIYQGDMLIRA